VIAVLLNSRKRIIQRLTLRSLCFLLLILPLFISAQTNSLTLDDLLQSAEQWANENLDDDALRVLFAKERPELDRRRMAYRGELAPLSVAGKTVIIVDDGAATGTTMKVAIRALKRRSPRKIIVGLPVAPADTVTELAQEANLVICLSQPARFRALSYYYVNFPQLSDSEVLNAMDEVGRAQAGSRGSNKRRRPAAHANK